MGGARFASHQRELSVVGISVLFTRVAGFSPFERCLSVLLTCARIDTLSNDGLTGGGLTSYVSTQYLGRDLYARARKVAEVHVARAILKDFDSETLCKSFSHFSKCFNFRFCLKMFSICLKMFSICLMC